MLVFSMKKDFLNENHNFLLLASSQLEKIKIQIPSFSSKFRLKYSKFIDSLREITSVWSLNYMGADKLVKYIFQEIPDFVKHLKAVHPTANQSSNVLSRK